MVAFLLSLAKEALGGTWQQREKEREREREREREGGKDGTIVRWI